VTIACESFDSFGHPRAATKTHAARRQHETTMSGEPRYQTVCGIRHCTAVGEWADVAEPKRCKSCLRRLAAVDG